MNYGTDTYSMELCTFIVGICCIYLIIYYYARKKLPDPLSFITFIGKPA